MEDISIVVNGTDIAPAVISAAHTSSLDTLGDKFTFQIPYSDLTRYNIPPLQIGDDVRLWADGLSPFIGMITKTSHTENARSYTCYDPCWYLNKSQITMQFVGVTIREAIISLMDECGIEPFMVADIAATVDETCYLETPAKIMHKLLERARDITGRRYHAYYGGFRRVNVEEVGSRSAGTVLAEITSPQREESIEDVRNRIKYVSGDSTGYYDTGISAEDGDSIAKYGVMQELIVAEEEDTDANAIVNNRLLQKKNPVPKVSLECAGSWVPRCGQRITLAEPITGISGEWILESIDRAMANGEYRMKLGLSAYTTMPTYEETFAEEIQAEAERKSSEGRGLSGGGVNSEYTQKLFGDYINIFGPT